MSRIEHITDDNFTEKVLQRDKPVLVDFWAEWCGPCHMIAPVLEEIADSQEKLDIVKLNTDENPRTPAAYRVMSIPNMKVFSGGKVVKEIIGAKPKAALLRDLDGFIS